MRGHTDARWQGHGVSHYATQRPDIVTEAAVIAVARTGSSEENACKHNHWFDSYVYTRHLMIFSELIGQRASTRVHDPLSAAAASCAAYNQDQNAAATDACGWRLSF